ncbi:MAG: hypothetical protein ACP5PK_07945 [candidate division WOR-3 bacterium]
MKLYYLGFTPVRAAIQCSRTKKPGIKARNLPPYGTKRGGQKFDQVIKIHYDNQALLL